MEDITVFLQENKCYFYDGRLIIKVQWGNIKQAFYRSTSAHDENDRTRGIWFPFDGIGCHDNEVNGGSLFKKANYLVTDMNKIREDYEDDEKKKLIDLEYGKKYIKQYDHRVNKLKMAPDPRFSDQKKNFLESPKKSDLVAGGVLKPYVPPYYKNIKQLNEYRGDEPDVSGLGDVILKSKIEERKKQWLEAKKFTKANPESNGDETQAASYAREIASVSEKEYIKNTYLGDYYINLLSQNYLRRFAHRQELIDISYILNHTENELWQKGLNMYVSQEIRNDYENAEPRIDPNTPQIDATYNYPVINEFVGDFISPNYFDTYIYKTNIETYGIINLNNNPRTVSYRILLMHPRSNDALDYIDMVLRNPELRPYFRYTAYDEFKCKLLCMNESNDYEQSLGEYLPTNVSKNEYDIFIKKKLQEYDSVDISTNSADLVIILEDKVLKIYKDFNRYELLESIYEKQISAVEQVIKSHQEYQIIITEKLEMLGGDIDSKTSNIIYEQISDVLQEFHGHGFCHGNPNKSNIGYRQNGSTVEYVLFNFYESKAIADDNKCLKKDKETLQESLYTDWRDYTVVDYK